MQSDLLISNFKNPEIIALVKTNIERIQDGSFPHCAEALNFVFKKAFELKKKRQSGVELRCQNPQCSRKISSAPHWFGETVIGFCGCDRDRDFHYLH